MELAKMYTAYILFYFFLMLFYSSKCSASYRTESETRSVDSCIFDIHITNINIVDVFCLRVSLLYFHHCLQNNIEKN